MGRRTTRIKSIFITINVSSNTHEITTFEEFQLENNCDICPLRMQLLSLRFKYGKGQLCYTVSLKSNLIVTKVAEKKKINFTFHRNKHDM